MILQQAGLAGAVRPDHADLGARVEGQRDVLQHLFVGRVEPADLVHREDVLRCVVRHEADKPYRPAGLVPESGLAAGDGSEAGRATTWSTSVPHDPRASAGAGQASRLLHDYPAGRVGGHLGADQWPEVVERDAAALVTLRALLPLPWGRPPRAAGPGANGSTPGWGRVVDADAGWGSRHRYARRRG